MPIVPSLTLQFDPLGQLGLGVAGRVQNDAANGKMRSFAHDLLDGIARRDHRHAVRILRQRRHRRVAEPIADLVVLRIHQVNVAAESGKIRQHSFAEGSGLGRGADDANIPRIENAIEFGVPINRPSSLQLPPWLPAAEHTAILASMDILKGQNGHRHRRRKRHWPRQRHVVRRRRRGGGRAGPRRRS